MNSQERKGDPKGSPFSSIVARIIESNSKPERRREIGLIEEVRIGFRFVKHGLREVDQIRPGNDFYHPPILFLSIGLERILKCMICMDHKINHGSYPTHNDKLWPHGNKGHNLVLLKDMVVAFCVELSGQDHTDDYRLLTADHWVDGLLKLLSDYGMRSRYFNLNELLLDRTTLDPMTEYDRFTGDLAYSVHGEKLMELVGNPSKSKEAYILMNREFKSLVERLVRALTRQFIFGTIQDEGKRFLSDLSPFYRIDDKDLGIRSY